VAVETVAAAAAVTAVAAAAVETVAAAAAVTAVAAAAVTEPSSDAGAQWAPSNQSSAVLKGAAF